MFILFILGGNTHSHQQIRNDGKSGQINSHYLNVNPTHKNTSHIQGNSNDIVQPTMNETNISNPNYKGNTISGDATGNSWAGQGIDVSKMYNYGSLAVSNNGNGISPYSASVIIKCNQSLIAKNIIFVYTKT